MDVLEFQHLHYDGPSQGQGSSFGLVYDDVDGEAVDVLLLWKEDVGLRQWLDEDGGHGNPALYGAAHLTKPTGVLPVQSMGVRRILGTVDHVSFSAVPWIFAKRMNLAKGAFSTAALAWERAHPHFCHPLAPSFGTCRCGWSARRGISPGPFFRFSKGVCPSSSDVPVAA